MHAAGYEPGSAVPWTQADLHSLVDQLDALAQQPGQDWFQRLRYDQSSLV